MSERREPNWQKAVFTHEDDDTAGHLYYFAPQDRPAGPYLKQRHVRAIIDIAADGTLAGVELIDDMPPLRADHATAMEAASPGYTERRNALKKENR